jgi:hypothetical protein
MYFVYKYLYIIKQKIDIIMKKITQLFCAGLFVFTSFGQAQTARVQIIHNSPDLAAATVDVYLNNTILSNDFAFRTSTPFLTVPAGVPLSIDVAPSTSTSSAQGIYNLTTTLISGATYVIVANGIVSATGYFPMQPFALNVFAQGREVAVNPTSTDVLVNHGSPDAPTVDVVETSVPAGTVINDISYPSFVGYLGLVNLDYILDIRNASGTTTVASYQAPLQTLGLQGAAITVLASGFLNPAVNSNGPAFGLWVALAAGGPLVSLPLNNLNTDNFNLSKIALYPNPTSRVLTIDIPFGYEKLEGKIFDVSGREVKTFSNPSSIDVSDLNSGLYVVNVTVDGLTSNKKFVKK